VRVIRVHISRFDGASTPHAARAERLIAPPGGSLRLRQHPGEDRVAENIVMRQACRGVQRGQRQDEPAERAVQFRIDVPQSSMQINVVSPAICRSGNPPDDGQVGHV